MLQRRNGSSHGRQTRNYLRQVSVLAAPAKSHLDLHRGLRRAASSVIVQLQTGKIALALGTFGAAPTTECPCGLHRPTRCRPHPHQLPYIRTPTCATKCSGTRRASRITGGFSARDRWSRRPRNSCSGPGSWVNLELSPHPTESQPAARRTSIRLQSGTHKLRRSPCSLPLGASSPLHPLYIALGLCKPSSCLSFCQSTLRFVVGSSPTAL
jgi:hypothetical protein